MTQEKVNASVARRGAVSLESAFMRAARREERGRALAALVAALLKWASEDQARAAGHRRSNATRFPARDTLARIGYESAFIRA